MALAGLHRDSTPGDRLHLLVDPPDAIDLDLLIEGAGFTTDGGGTNGRINLERRLSLPDTVGPDMRVLVVGLNPSVYAAEHGVGFARPGNRFWPAAIEAGPRDRRP